MSDSATVTSTVATEPDFTKDGFYDEFSKLLGFFYHDIVGLEGSSGLRSDQPCRRRVGKGDEFNKAVPAPPPAPAAPAPAAEWCQSDEPPTSVSVPKLAPAILRPARAPCRARRLPSQAASRE